MSPDAGGPPAKEPEFTAEHPLLVNVGWIKGKWDIQPSTDTFPLDEKRYSDKMWERVRAINEINKQVSAMGDPKVPHLTKVFGDRRVKGGPREPKFVSETDHIPIVIRPWEYVRFRSEHPFRILATRDKNVLPETDSPDSPFVWPASQWSQQSSLSTERPYFVIGVAQRNLHQQRFYKCVAWVMDKEEVHLIDPDTVGTTDGGG